MASPRQILTSFLLTLLLSLFHSHTPNEVSGMVPGPDVGGRSQRVGVGGMLLPKRERHRDSSRAEQPCSGARVGDGPRRPQLFWPCQPTVVSLAS